jgi:hypothetical protein
MTTNKLRKTGIIVSTALGIILSVAAICLAISVIWTDKDLKLVSLISNNWLLKIFKLQAHIINNHDILLGINLYDIGIILLFILVCLALFEKFKFQYKVWFSISISLMVLGLVVFIITNLAGRSAFMASGLIISSLFFSNNIHSKVAGFTGIIANVLLLTADFTVDANIKIIPFLFGVGYILLIVWIFMIARILTMTEKDPTSL